MINHHYIVRRNMQQILQRKRKEWWRRSIKTRELIDPFLAARATLSDQDVVRVRPPTRVPTRIASYVVHTHHRGSRGDTRHRGTHTREGHSTIPTDTLLSPNTSRRIGSKSLHFFLSIKTIRSLFLFLLRAKERR